MCNDGHRNSSSPSFFRFPSVLIIGHRFSVPPTVQQQDWIRTSRLSIHSSEEKDKSDTFVYVLEYVPNMSPYLLTILKMHPSVLRRDFGYGCCVGSST
jgi:hypothetical protein